MTHHSSAQQETLGQTNKHMVEVSRKELPLSCPMSGQQSWNAHPRVFLPIEDNGEADCPYCGTHYTLKDF